VRAPEGERVSVGVFGSSRPVEGEPAYEEARTVGRELARRGARVVCGGYGGVMEAACRGAAEEGGESLGVVLAEKGAPNRWVSRALVAADLAERLMRLMDESRAAIFLPRGLGTMLEIVWMAECITKGDIPPRPLVFLGESWRGVVAAAVSEAAGPGREALASSVFFVSTPAEAAERALSPT
jgi:uncharacterized protein (TIGR00725 family)